MGINLQKGQKIDLTKGGGGLRQVMDGMKRNKEVDSSLQSHNQLIVMLLQFYVVQMES